MKKYLLVILALLLTIGIANATNIPSVTDPKNYPTVWTELVYNGSGSNIATGVCVQWDFATSNPDGTIYDDTAPWVKLVDSADDIWTAGVTSIARETGASTDIAISNGNVGRIIIKGPAVVHKPPTGETAVTVNTVVSSDASGYVYDESGGADKTTLGIVIANDASGNDIEGSIGTGSALIYINPVQEAN